MTALIAALAVAAIAVPFVVVGLIYRFKTARDTFDILVPPPHEPIVDLGSADDLAFDEAEHIKALAPKLTVVPDGFTCLGCHETDALPDSIWCAVCSERVRNFPSEPIERGQR